MKHETTTGVGRWITAKHLRSVLRRLRRAEYYKYRYSSSVMRWQRLQDLQDLQDLQYLQDRLATK